LQTCAKGPLQVWEVVLQACGVPLQICGPVLHFAAWTLLQAAATKPLQAGPATPTHCGGW
jgi:hypothetical protein